MGSGIRARGGTGRSRRRAGVPGGRRRRGNGGRTTRPASCRGGRTTGRASGHGGGADRRRCGAGRGGPVGRGSRAGGRCRGGSGTRSAILGTARGHRSRPGAGRGGVPEQIALALFRVACPGTPGAGPSGTPGPGARVPRPGTGVTRPGTAGAGRRRRRGTINASARGGSGGGRTAPGLRTPGHPRCGPDRLDERRPVGALPACGGPFRSIGLPGPGVRARTRRRRCGRRSCGRGRLGCRGGGADRCRSGRGGCDRGGGPAGGRRARIPIPLVSLLTGPRKVVVGTLPLRRRSAGHERGGRCWLCGGRPGAAGRAAGSGAGLGVRTGSGGAAGTTCRPVRLPTRRTARGAVQRRQIRDRAVDAAAGRSGAFRRFPGAGTRCRPGRRRDAWRRSAGPASISGSCVRAGRGIRGLVVAGGVHMPSPKCPITTLRTVGFLWARLTVRASGGQHGKGVGRAQEGQQVPNPPGVARHGSS